MGVSALLGIVVKWLLSHITDLTKQSMELVALRDKVTVESQKDFRAALLEVTAHCEREITRQAIVQHDRDVKTDAVITRQTETLEELKDVIAALHAKILTTS